MKNYCCSYEETVRKIPLSVNFRAVQTELTRGRLPLEYTTALDKQTEEKHEANISA